MTRYELLEKTSIAPEVSAEEKQMLPIEIEYYMTVSYTDSISAHKASEVYGMLVSKKLGESVAEGTLIRNYSCSREDTALLVKKLAANKVTPVELPYIIDDFIGT